MSAPAFDFGVSAPGGQGAGSFNWSHTISGSDRILLVGVFYAGGATDNGISSVTFGAASLTKIPGWSITDPVTSTLWHNVWYLLAPTVGTDTITVTFTGAPADSAGGSASYTGVNQSSPFGTLATATGTNNAPRVTVSSASGETVFASAMVWKLGDPPDVTPATGVTEEFDGHANAVDNYHCTGGDAIGAASVTVGWDHTSTPFAWTIGGIPLKPVSSLTRFLLVRS